MSRDVVADIGGTNVRFGSIDETGKGINNLHNFLCSDYDNIALAIEQYCHLAGISKIRSLCLAVPGLINQNEFRFPNNHWHFCKDELQTLLGCDIQVINDFTAQALALEYMRSDRLVAIGHVECPLVDDIKVCVGPGTGFGVAVLMPSGEVVPSEAGHIAWAPLTGSQIALLEKLLTRYTRVSVERVCSGKGLENIFWARYVHNGSRCQLQAREIVEQAANGDVQCQSVVEEFLDILASVCGDMALMMGGTSLYICGGIMPKILSVVEHDRFRQFFEHKGRFSQFCSQVPIHVITESHSGLLGCIRKLELS